jgi:hypothetical protein
MSNMLLYHFFIFISGVSFDLATARVQWRVPYLPISAPKALRTWFTFSQAYSITGSAMLTSLQ